MTRQFHRREMMQVGCSSLLGLTLPSLLSTPVRAVSAKAMAKTGRAKSVVLVFLTGGGSHIDTFDPKPDSADVRGEFKPISTSIPGVQFTEHVPKLAERANRLAIVRSMAHKDNRHLSGTHNTLTGSEQPFRGNANEDKELNRGDWPVYGSTVAHLLPSSDGIPSQVTIPNPLIEGNLTCPGQHAGILGAKHDPFQINGDPNQDEFHVNGLQLPDGLSVERLAGRRSLLQQLGGEGENLDCWASRQKFSQQQDAAYAMLTSSSFTKAFQIQSEPDAVRDRYGRNRMGQTLLLARRLVECEIPVVQCNMGRVQSWDNHSDIFPKLKDKLLSPLDQGVSALLDDLRETGMLDQTLVIVVGEFGRSPKISQLNGKGLVGRGHWAYAYTALFAGAGVQEGQVLGKTDKIGAYPLSTPFHPNDLGATVYNSLGIDPNTVIHNSQGRPTRLNQGKVMHELFGSSQG
jgi:hypothetical protein